MSGIARKLMGAAAKDDLFEGGYFVGNITIAGVDYGLVYEPLPATPDTYLWQEGRAGDTFFFGTSPNDGFFNTYTILAEGGDFLPASDYCRNLTTSGFTDWYLPSLEELTVARQNENLLPVEQIESIPYWSSSESGASTVFIVNPDGSGQTVRKVIDFRRARAMRRFEL